VTTALVAVQPSEQVPVARVTGEIDVANAADVAAQLSAAVSNAAHGLVVDLAGVEYVDSAGLRGLLDLAVRMRRRGQRLAAVAPEGSPVRRVLELIELGRVAELCGSVGDARARMA
jgi:stage II sporulation protein AA (anti-sigma F factor antagonist)